VKIKRCNAESAENNNAEIVEKTILLSNTTKSTVHTEKIKRCSAESAEKNNAKDAEKTNLFVKTPHTLCLSGEKNTVISAISALKGRCKS
jgi:hypothetical protein